MDSNASMMCAYRYFIAVRMKSIKSIASNALDRRKRVGPDADRFAHARRVSTKSWASAWSGLNAAKIGSYLLFARNAKNPRNANLGADRNANADRILLKLTMNAYPARLVALSRTWKSSATNVLVLIVRKIADRHVNASLAVRKSMVNANAYCAAEIVRILGHNAKIAVMPISTEVNVNRFAFVMPAGQWLAEGVRLSKSAINTKALRHDATETNASNTVCVIPISYLLETSARRLGTATDTRSP